jgi:sugar/nucleoside kinase (ribokinase family)
LKRFDVAVLHDYFVDRLVHTGEIKSFIGMIERKNGEGGGGIHGVSQEDIRGGNAVNLAHALSVLGATTLLITHSDSHHLPLLVETFEGLDAELRVKPLPAGLTVAFEGRTNVMVSRVGGAGAFSPELLDETDWKMLKGCRIVCSENWAANSKGTQLLVALRKKLGGKAVIFLNPADFRDQLGRFATLCRLMKKTRIIDWLSVNEYEAAAAASALGLRIAGSGAVCRAISGALGIRVDVHTDHVSYSCTEGLLVSARAKRVAPRRLTGAGDVWDAASIYAWLHGYGEGERLKFANAAGRAYVSSPSVAPPRLAEVRMSLLEHS